MAKFQVTQTGIKDLIVIEPTVFGDNRGYFMETYSEREFAEVGLTMKFVQDNQSKSKKGVLRGLHFQINHPQGKLVRVISGEVFDVAVDLREGSETYGKWYGIRLSAENKKDVLCSGAVCPRFPLCCRTRRSSATNARISMPPGMRAASSTAIRTSASTGRWTELMR